MIKPIAIHLPQFHPFAENDEWWGKGFTEWTNVTKAKPLFKDHHQPQLPADLGFYDLRLEESRVAQAELAKQHGIYGFCYYHYWFNGKRLMNRPLDDMLKSQTPDFPFMLCWANENWSRRWDGQDQEILIKQDYSHEDDIEHIKFLCTTFFADKRYIKVDNKPFITIYRPALFPDIKRTINTWREEAAKLGFELYIGYTQSFNYKIDPKEVGFDCAIEFHPDFSLSGPKIYPTFFQKLEQKITKVTSPFLINYITSYKKYINKAIKRPTPPNVYKGLMAGFDNSARKKRQAHIFLDSNPADYEKWLENICSDISTDTFIFINAWNEWAEGNYLEPSQKWGSEYLKATRRVIETFNKKNFNGNSD